MFKFAPLAIPTMLDILTLALSFIVVMLACHILTRRTRAEIARDNERDEDILRAVFDTASEYCNAFDNDYSARDARAHIRAYIHYSYPLYSKDVQREIMRDAIHEAMLIMHAERQSKAMESKTKALSK
jgi:hypothetical protein